MKVKIRKAQSKDFSSILKLIKELADFEKLKSPTFAAQKRLRRDAFNNRYFNILVAESNKEIIGYAFYFFTYSSFLAKKTLFLEDLFITVKFRNNGIGKLFFKALNQIAKKNKCGRIEWSVLDWNKNAINFYNKLGAKHLKEWYLYRIVL